MMARLEAVLNRFEVSIAEANDLVVLQDYEMVIIGDDSGSMLNAAEPAHLRALGAPVKTRWNELGETITQIVDLACCFDESGVDVYFLNREPVLGVKSIEDAAFLQAIQAPPRGTTPLTETMQRVAQRSAGERKVLLFILTDGEPNGGKGPFIQALRSVVASKRTKVQIMACTAEDDEIGWLNELDRELAEVDVVDDYRAEREQVIRVGLATRFSRGDWCLKAMLGPVSHKFDAWDEQSGRKGGGVSAPQVAGADQACCSMM